MSDYLKHEHTVRVANPRGVVFAEDNVEGLVRVVLESPVRANHAEPLLRGEASSTFVRDEVAILGPEDDAIGADDLALHADEHSLVRPAVDVSRDGDEPDVAVLPLASDALSCMACGEGDR